MKAKSAASPFIAWVLIFTVAPLCLVVYFALTDASMAFTLDNIANIKEYFPTLGESILLGAVATLLCLLLGYPMGYFISRMGCPLTGDNDNAHYDADVDEFPAQNICVDEYFGEERTY